MNPEFVYQLAAGLVMAAATYGGIRADIKAMHQRISMAEKAAKRAHKRIDKHMRKRTHHDKETHPQAAAAHC